MPASATKNGIVTDSSFINLKQMEISKVRREVLEMLLPDEEIISAFNSIRDQVLTTKRVITVNVQGITGKKVSYFSYPYRKVAFWGLESAGVLDIDSELMLSFVDGTSL